MFTLRVNSSWEWHETNFLNNHNYSRLDFRKTQSRAWVQLMAKSPAHAHVRTDCQWMIRSIAGAANRSYPPCGSRSCAALPLLFRKHVPCIRQTCASVASADGVLSRVGESSWMDSLHGIHPPSRPPLSQGPLPSLCLTHVLKWADVINAEHADALQYV